MIRPTLALIDLNALRNNIRVLRSRTVGNPRMMAVVKANCYGHGVDLCVPVMLDEGISLFGIATVEEGEQLRALAPEARIAVLPPPPVGQTEAYLRHNLEATVSDRSTADELAACAAKYGGRVRVHVHVDTGMTRNGARVDDVVDLVAHIRRLEVLDVIGLASHFATSDDDVDYARLQSERFAMAVARLSDAGHLFSDVHLANSGGIYNLPLSHHTVVRPGISLYGYHPSRADQTDSALEPVMSLRTRVSGVQRIEAGTPVSYGCTWRSSSATNIATLPLGYADGLMRTLSGRLNVLIDGRRYRVVGTISMDEIMVDVGTSTAVSRGDEVVVIGSSGSESNTAWDLATAAGTIPYEICTNVSARVPRRALSHEDQHEQLRTSPTLSSTQ